jgi:hypothetical protein
MGKKLWETALLNSDTSITVIASQSVTKTRNYIICKNPDFLRLFIYAPCYSDSKTESLGKDFYDVTFHPCNYFLYPSYSLYQGLNEVAGMKSSGIEYESNWQY